MQSCEAESRCRLICISWRVPLTSQPLSEPWLPWCHYQPHCSFSLPSPAGVDCRWQGGLCSSCGRPNSLLLTSDLPSMRVFIRLLWNGGRKPSPWRKSGSHILWRGLWVRARESRCRRSKGPACTREGFPGSPRAPSRCPRCAHVTFTLRALSALHHPWPAGYGSGIQSQNSIIYKDIPVLNYKAKFCQYL